ncbi:hypothetical protein H7H82_17910 [Mycobacterium heidelbergense]|uniref:hypothetical protein n=1 Tax=Mycobacterium heidelbergense TaxID=53376 RepID=UPI00115096E7|nr:hypothetical protein [Mycobacterium heidelbergense]MCV7052445.1 hypothetical protein [Mycobacterium heidelbergense]BBZ50433.1 hypothetical protein MHEI_21500 [Mycobacterium heidelbergense]
MDLAARPHITTGVALASAAVLAVSPMVQHLPDLRLAHQLSQISVSNIQLAGAADSMVDLFAGVENELASLAGGVGAVAVPAAALTDFINPAALPLPLATWVNTFQATGANLQTLYNTWSKVPFVIPQQAAANWVDYANTYVGAYQTSAAAAVGYFTGNTSSSFGPLLQTAWTDLTTGKISAAVSTLYLALYNIPISNILLPLEKILQIPVDITKNLSNATSYLVNTDVTFIGLLGLFSPVAAAQTALGSSLQAVYNSWTGGDALGALANLLNTPGATTNAALNGFTGLLGSNGLVHELVTLLNPGLAQQIVAPSAVNIATGGSLSGAAQAFVNQLTNGWPSLTPVVNTISGGLTSLLHSIPSVVANLPSILSNFGGLLASNIGLLISNLLKLL